MNNPVVGVIMGSSSDWEVMKHAADILSEFNVPYEAEVVSAHRTPDRMFEYAAIRALPAGIDTYCFPFGGQSS